MCCPGRPRHTVFVLRCVSELCGLGLARGGTRRQWPIPGLPDAACPSVLLDCAPCQLNAEGQQASRALGEPQGGEALGA